MPFPSLLRTCGFETTYKELKHRLPGDFFVAIFCFETTYKELKQVNRATAKLFCVYRFETTYKELKLGELRQMGIPFQSFETTYKELKQICLTTFSQLVTKF